MTKNLKVTVDGKVYAVTVELLDEGGDPGVLPAVAPAAPLLASVPVAAPAPARPAAVPSTGSGDVRSPLSGKVASVDVKPGQQVTEGQQVMTLEAMKMNTYVYAPRTGTVSTVHVNPGDAVEEGVVLMAIA
ncbi:MAG: biotin/lipoyl-binding protein [Opitutaceae bacterium]|nr:biotin/lipoyl-binding protein [Opitutaceae bacterium]